MILLSITSLLLSLLLPPITTAIYYDPVTARTTYPTVTLEFEEMEEPDLYPAMASVQIPLVHRYEYGILESQKVGPPLIVEDLLTRYKADNGGRKFPPAIIQLHGGKDMREHLHSLKKKLVRIVDPPESAFRTYCTYMDKRTGFSYRTHEEQTDLGTRHFAKELQLPMEMRRPEFRCAAFYINPEFEDEMMAFLGSLDKGGGEQEQEQEQEEWEEQEDDDKS